jgi:serine/threonine protein kinase/TolB-like protein/Tfp pilus assembly protein PilF
MKCPKCQFDNPDATNFCGKCGVPLAADARMADSLTKTLATPLPVIAKDKLIAGKYRILEEIGRGGMGVVYRAEDLKLKRSVALKFLPPHLVDSPELKERFLIEAQAAAALNHPNICVIHEVGESEERPFIAMEYVEGETLRDKVKKGPLKSEEALDIAIQIAAGLGEAHRKGIIHRDIKSANIMVTDKGQAKVMDFGLAKLRGGSSLTKSQTTLGTIAYMSPEQARGDDLDPRTDIWSLGVVLYELLAGKLPFRGDHDQTVIHSILHKEPESLIKARPGLAPEMGQIIGQALAKKPADRYQTMEEFREDLEAVAEGLKPLRAKRRRVRRILGIRTAYVYSALVILLALILGLNVGGLRDRILGRTAPVPAMRLAVLPFENLSGDPEQEYFSDGMTGEMIAQLGRLHPGSLSVIARESVKRYKKTNTPINQVGRELNVGYVLAGSAQREGTRVRITAELIKVQDQTQLWADSYEREMSGILALQNEVSQKVARALALKLLPAEQARLADAPTVNPEAYDACLRGYHYYIFTTKADLDTADKYFQLALAKDPNYALAYAGLALVWACRQQIGYVPPAEAGPKAKEAAQKAVALDGSSAEAHYALADIMTWTTWDLKDADGEWKRSVELNPNYADSLAAYSHYLMIMGRPEEAMRQIERAVKLDPYNVMVLTFYAYDLYMARRYDEAIAQALKARELQPGSPIAISALLYAYASKGMEKETLAVVREYIKIYGIADVDAALDRGFKQGGFQGAMKTLAEKLATPANQGLVLPSDVSLYFLIAGDKKNGLEWIERAYEAHDPSTPYLRFPIYDSIRSEPRFQALFRRLGLKGNEKK